MIEAIVQIVTAVHPVFLILAYFVAGIFAITGLEGTLSISIPGHEPSGGVGGRCGTLG